MPKLFLDAAQDPAKTEILVHENGIRDEDVEAVYKTQVRHDPRDLDSARHLAEEASKVRLGLFYCNPERPRYDETRRLPTHTAEERIQIIESEFDRHAV